MQRPAVPQSASLVQAAQWLVLGGAQLPVAASAAPGRQMVPSGQSSCCVQAPAGSACPRSPAPGSAALAHPARRHASASLPGPRPRLAAQ